MTGRICLVILLLCCNSMWYLGLLFDSFILKAEVRLRKVKTKFHQKTQRYSFSVFVSRKIPFQYLEAHHVNVARIYNEIYVHLYAVSPLL